MRRIVKLRKVGGSTIMTMPNDIIDELGWQPDDEMCVSINPDDQSSVLVEYERRPPRGGNDE